MLLSVIIPIYNVSKYLEECLDSILNQTIKDLEIILINDCSPDPNDDLICMKYKDKDPRIKYIKHDVNQGISFTRNEGLNLASGKYFYFIDSDDFLSDNNILNKAVTILEENEKINFVGFGYSKYYNGKIIFSHKLSDIIYQKESCFNIEDCFDCYLWMKVFRLKDIRDNNLQFTPNDIIEDVIFHFDYYYKVKPIYKFINTKAYMYRKRNDSITTSDKNRKKLFDAFVYFIDYLNAINMFDKMYNYINELFIENIIFEYMFDYDSNDFCCKEQYLKIFNCYRMNYLNLDRRIYKRNYKKILKNKEKFLELYPKYKFRSHLYYKIMKNIYLISRKYSIKNY